MQARLIPNLQAGISLIEVVVAVLVLSIGVVAGFQSLGQARRGIGAELPRLMAHSVALNRAAEIRLAGAAAAPGLAPVVTAGGINWTVDVDLAATRGGFAEARIHVSAAGQPGAIYVVHAPVEPPQ